MHFTHYFRKDEAGRLLMVVGGPAPPAPELMRRFFPQLAEVEFQYQWNGIVGVSPNHLPRVHRPAAGLTAVAGYSGRGLTTATMVGKLLAQHLSGAHEQGDLPMPVERLERILFRDLKTVAANSVINAARWMDALA